jgi:aspartyl-tRNA(Asn)/glutamyl-tRNA(Gln) amidotransferase subunit A
MLGASLTDQAAAVRRGDISAGALLELHLQRIAARQSALNAWRAVDEEGARAQAAAIDARVAQGHAATLGPLAGVPMAVKDQLCTRGLVTSAGSRMLEHWRPPYDATAVARLRQAGAVIVGKTNQDEFAMGSTSASCAFGPVLNPCNPAHVAGGSSGGSAVAVADYQAAGALGTDTGGSIRQPASFCGLVGVKPTWGRVSRYGAIAYASSLDQIGPMTRTVGDAALLLQVIAGHDPADMTALRDPVPDYVAAVATAERLDGVRIGVPIELMGQGNAPDVAAAMAAVLTKCQELGATLIDVHLPHTAYAIQTYYLVAMAEASSNLARFDGLRYGHRAAGTHELENLIAASRAEGFGLEVKRRILLGTFALSAGYHDAFYGRAQQVRTLIRRDFEAAYAQCDVIACPTSPVTAPRLDARGSDPLAEYLMDIDTVMSNLAGHCSLSLPVGFDSGGLPIGLQLMGPHLAEAAILRAAAVIERAVGFRQRLDDGGPA